MYKGLHKITSGMRCIVGRAWASSAWKEEQQQAVAWRGKEKHWLLLLHLQHNYATRVDRGCACGTYLHFLISGAWAVSLVPRPEDRMRLLSSSLRSPSGPAKLSVAFLYRNAGRGLGTRLHLSRETTSAQAARFAFSYVLGLLSLCSFCSAVSTARSAVTFDSTFLFDCWGSSVVCVGHFENTIVPYGRPPKLHFKNLNINYPLDLL